ncbi:DUF2569 family protein, partial [Mesorhizobium sp. M1A.T.Ca.IN.004.03.1.1]
EVMGLLKTLASGASSMETHAKYSAVEGGELVAVGEAALSFALVILQVVVIWFMFKKDRMFPRLFFYQWIAIPVAFVLDLA